jgi:hypothetical protein
MTNQFEVEFYRHERPPEPAEETLNWSVQLSIARPITFGDLSEVLHQMRLAGVPNDAQFQINGNLVMAWKRRQL